MIAKEQKITLRNYFQQVKIFSESEPDSSIF